MMRPEDELFIQRCEMTLEDLHRDYDAIDLSEHEIRKDSLHKDIYLEILTFESIIDECKHEVSDSSLDEIRSNLNLVYHMHLGEDEGHEKTLVKLDQVTCKFLSSKKYKQDVNEQLLNHHREDMELILGIKNILKERLLILSQEKKWFIIPRTIAIHRYQKLLEDFEAVELKIRENFTRISEIITTCIVESFHYIYLYFSYCIKYFLHTDNQLVLVEIAASIDRFIKVMQPLIKTTTLKNDNLRNFYVIYELKLLQELIVKHYE